MHGIARNWTEVKETIAFGMNCVQTNLRGDIPLVYTLGNLDVYPKDSLRQGPNKILKGLSEVLDAVLPQDQRRTFRRGGYYVRIVVAKKLAVVSLNTLYFATYNSKVRGCGCGAKSRGRAGCRQLRWLATQLAAFRKAGMGVYLIGHTAPFRGSWFDGCLDKFSKLAVTYSDVIRGQFFGHINFDVFSFVASPPLRRRHRVWCPMDDASPLSESRKIVRRIYHQLNDLRLDSPSPSQLAVTHTGASVIPKNMPGFKLYQYQPQGERLGDITETWQYSMNLKKANKHPNRAKFKLTYRLSDTGVQWNSTADWLRYVKELFHDDNVHEQFLKRLYPFRKTPRDFVRKLRRCLLAESDALLEQHKLLLQP
jgi:hypothetical protein